MNDVPMWRRIQRLLGANIAADIDDELQSHLEMRTRDLERSGMSPAEARAEAVRRFGDVDAVKAEVAAIERVGERRSRRSEWLGDLLQDIRYGVRVLARSPGFTVAAVGTLALGIGANAAVFSAVNSVLLRPLPFPEPDRLVMLWEENPERDWYMQTVAPANMFDWRERVTGLDDIAGIADFNDRLTMVGAGDPIPLVARSVTGNFFSVLGARPSAGRLFVEDETWSTGEAAVVLSHETWLRVFGGDPSAIDRTVRLNGAAYRIVGVAPPDFRLPGVEAEIWRPIRWEPGDAAETSFRRAHYLRAIGRLAPGATLEGTEAELRAVAASLETEFPETNRLMGAGLTPLHEFLVGDVSATLLVLWGAVVVLLLLAVTNVGNLLLARSFARRREIAVRGALGAGRGRLLRQVIVESMVLSTVGAVLGVLSAWVFIRALTGLGTSAVMGPMQLALDVRFIVYIVGLLLVAGIIFTLAPAALATRMPLSESLKEGDRATASGPAVRRVANVLVAGEVAMALLLLAGAMLLGRSFAAIQQVNPGFDSTGVLTGGLSAPASTYETEERVIAFYDDLLGRVESLPGVEAAALVRQLSMTTTSWTSDFFIAGREPDQYGVDVVHREVSAGYFEAMRVPVLRGRTLSFSDRADSEPVIVINEALAQQYFPDSDPIGQKIAFNREPSADARWWTVIGVVGAEIQGSPVDGARIEIFAPLTQAVTRGVNLVVRTSGQPGVLAQPIVRAIRELNPELVLTDVRTMEDVRREAVARERFVLVLLGSFAAIALVLAIVGVYGVMAQSIRGRRREIGIRLALGAKRADLLSLILRQSLVLLVSGIVVGLIGFVLTSRAVASLVYGVGSRDPIALAVAVALLVGAGLTAASVPVLRAGRIPPSVVLREE